jgi:hypothetical protein
VPTPGPRAHYPATRPASAANEPSQPERQMHIMDKAGNSSRGTALTSVAASHLLDDMAEKLATMSRTMRARIAARQSQSLRSQAAHTAAAPSRAMALYLQVGISKRAMRQLEDARIAFKVSSTSGHAGSTSQSLVAVPSRSNYRTVWSHGRIDEAHPATPAPAAAAAPLTIHSDGLFPEFQGFELDFQPQRTSTPLLVCGVCPPSDVESLTVDLRSSFW